jgi:DNA-binding transcriptional regulator YhcF (GntR family)
VAAVHFSFDQTSPIYQQIAAQLEEMIFTGGFKEGSQIPSTNELSRELHINPATVLKGMNLLVDAGLLEKHRGMGTFVSKGAHAQVVEERRKSFYDEYVVNVVDEAQKLNLSEERLIELIKRGYEENGHAEN